MSLADFSSSGVTYLNLADTNANFKGFIGGFTDGTYAYFVPHNNGGGHGNVVRLAIKSHTPGTGWISSP